MVDTSHSVLESELPVDASKVEKIVVEPNQCDVDCVITGSNRCIDEVDQCVGASKPIQQSDYDKVHLICDNKNPDGSWNGDCGASGQPSAGGLAYVGGDEGSSVHYGSAYNTEWTVAHEVGHNLDLGHIFNEAMLKSGWNFGDVYDPDTVNPSISGCMIPGQYTSDAGSGDKQLQDYTGFPNEGDNDDGTTSTSYFLSYCDPTDQYGPDG